MYLIVGLGNPGEKYAETRHNVGFMVVDALAKGKEWKFEKKVNAEICRLNPDVILMKPFTFMNLSGESVKGFLTYYKELLNSGFQIATHLWTIHDEIDLPFESLRIKQGGGTAGHNGLKSLVQQLGTEDFVRFRVGIGRSPVVPADQHVLQPFSPDEKKKLPVFVHRVTKAVEHALDSSIKNAMNSFNS